MQQSLRKFAEDRPEKASKLGITSNPGSSSDSDIDFKPDSKKAARSRKNQRETKNYIESDEDEATLDTFTALAGTRKRKNANNKEPEKPPEIIRKFLFNQF